MHVQYKTPHTHACMHTHIYIHIYRGETCKKEDGPRIVDQPQRSE